MSARQTNFSRRALAKGVAWSVPTAAVVTVAPAFAASTCPNSVTRAIDDAFDATNQSLVAYWTVDTVSALNGQSGLRPYLNINNNTPYDIVTGGRQLRVKLTYFTLDRTWNDKRGWQKDFFNNSVITSSYGGAWQRQMVTYTRDGVTYPAVEWVWDAAAGSKILGSGRGKDSTADMVLTSTNSLGATPPGAVVCAELVRAPQIVPTLESIIKLNPNAGWYDQSGKLLTSCQEYYEKHTTINSSFVFSGPKLSGTTTWNNDGKNTKLPGGNTAWSVGTTICSDKVGNYISDAHPPRVGGFPYGYDGIF